MVGSWQTLLVFLLLMVDFVAVVGLHFGSFRAQTRLLCEIWCRVVVSRALHWREFRAAPAEAPQRQLPPICAWAR